MLLSVFTVAPSILSPELRTRQENHNVKLCTASAPLGVAVVLLPEVNPLLLAILICVAQDTCAYVKIQNFQFVQGSGKM